MLLLQGPRAQIDRRLYKEHMQREMSNLDNLKIMAAPVEDLVLRESRQPDHRLMKQECLGVVLGKYAGEGARCISFKML